MVGLWSEEIVMKERIALVTGGTGGIGSAVCQALHEQGARVIASYNRGGNHEQSKIWQEQQRQKGYEINVSYVDITDYESCKILLENIEQNYGPVDILINNAGVTMDVQCHKMSLEAWYKVINTNLNGIFNMTRQVINRMIERNYGRIINISSINAHKGQFGQVNYSASKAGILGFTKALALEVARKGITVNTISPGYIATDMINSIPTQFREQIISQIPVGRFGDPAEVARAVVFLAAEESSFITGANLAINGGHYMA